MSANEEDWLEAEEDEDDMSWLGEEEEQPQVQGREEREPERGMSWCEAEEEDEEASWLQAEDNQDELLLEAGGDFSWPTRDISFLEAEQDVTDEEASWLTGSWLDGDGDGERSEADWHVKEPRDSRMEQASLQSMLQWAASLTRGTTAVECPVVNSVWAALRWLQGLICNCAKDSPSGPLQQTAVDTEGVVRKQPKPPPEARADRQKQVDAYSQERRC